MHGSAWNVSILSDFEDRLAGAVEGLFAGAFRSPVQPVEVAKALSKAMDDARSIGVGKVYVPLGYVVALSEEDSKRLGAFESTLGGELATYLSAHAREAGYHLTGKIAIVFEIDDDLRLGRFRVRPSEEVAHTPEEPVKRPAVGPPATQPPLAPPPPADVARRPYDWAESENGAVAQPESPLPGEEHEATATPLAALATVTVTGIHHDVVLRGERVEIGRLSSCDIALDDANVSRHHAAFVRDLGVSSRWAIEDLDSTNGTLVNDERIQERTMLHDGDTIQIGVSRLIYHEPRV